MRCNRRGLCDKARGLVHMEIFFRPYRLETKRLVNGGSSSAKVTWRVRMVEWPTVDERRPQTEHRNDEHDN